MPTAAQRRHLKAKRLQSDNLEALKSALTSGAAIAFFHSRLPGMHRDPAVRDTGILYGKMGSYDLKIGGHAVVLVGYRQDEEAPDDSYFVFDNSWGEGWAASSIYFGKGRGVLPFSYVKDHCVGRDAFILTE